jgi:hypothetical protein
LAPKSRGFSRTPLSAQSEWAGSAGGGVERPVPAAADVCAEAGAAAKVTGVIVAQKAPRPAVVMKWRRFARMAVPSRGKSFGRFLSVAPTMTQGRADQNRQNVALSRTAAASAKQR